MINIKNTQKKIKVDIKEIRSTIQKIMEIIGYSNFDVGIWLTTNKTIHKFNKQYRSKDKATDILSFPFHTNIRAGEKIKPKSEDDKNLGDIILSVEYAKKDSKKLGRSFEHHLKILLVHGICHLIGYDHIKDKDYEIMKALEEKILEKLTSK